jgi:hypothetical protein
MGDLPMAENFVEVRVFVADKDHKPADLSLVTADLALAPREGQPLKRGMQLMMPDPPQGSPEAEPQTLGGLQIRTTVARFDRPFELDKPGAGTPAVYFKADVPAELAKPSTSVTVHFTFPTGKQKIELKSLFTK